MTEPRAIPPDLDQPANVQMRYDRAREVIQRQDPKALASLQETFKTHLPRELAGETGWKATLFGLDWPIPSNTPETIYALWPILRQAADWWQDLGPVYKVERKGYNSGSPFSMCCEVMIECQASSEIAVKPTVETDQTASSFGEGPQR